MSAARQSFSARAWKFSSIIVRAILVPLAYAYFTLEYIVLLLPQVKLLRSADHVYAAWFWSFGHQATDLHMLAMRFRGKKLLAVLSDYGNINHYLIDTFRPYVSITILRHSHLAYLCWKNILGIAATRRLTHAIARTVLRITGNRAKFVEAFAEQERSIIEGIYINEYMECMRTSPLSVMTPCHKHLEEMRRLLLRTHPELAGRWCVALYLRKKQADTTDARDTPPLSYLLSIERLRALGGWIFCGGDYDPRNVFPGMENVLGYSDFPCDRELCDLYFLTQCLFVICGQSGPLGIPTVFRTPALVTNAAFYYLSACRENMMVLWKRVRDIRTERFLTARELFSPPVIGYSDISHFQHAGLRHVDNTPEELLAATEEMLQRYLFKNDSLNTNEYHELEQRFRALPSKQSVVYQSRAKPTLSYLRSLQWF